MKAIRGTATLAWVLAFLAVGACKSREEQLYELRSESRALVDALYAEYGGSVPARLMASEAASAAQKGAPAATFAEVLGNVAADVDRNLFVEDCRVLGRGDRPALLTDKARRYFETPSAREGCRRFATLAAKIAELEASTKGPTRP